MDYFEHNGFSYFDICRLLNKIWVCAPALSNDTQVLWFKVLLVFVFAKYTV